MDLVNEKVMHNTFGKGNVINYNKSYIKINFKSGDKRFVFPDAFRKYITFTDQRATNLVNKKIKIVEEERRIEEEKRIKEDLILKKERALKQEEEYILKQRKRIKSGRVNTVIQSVFWCEPDEEDEIFTEWKVFTGKVKSGKSKGQPRRLARMNENSACLLTRREDTMAEGDRQILGVFMANESFDGRSCEDGYITAHPEYRIQLSEEESEKILFWNYYVDKASSKNTIWNSGRQRYFDNIWMAQILRDIVSVKKQPHEREYAQAFFDYFCTVNFINQVELPSANGAMKRV